MCRAIDDRWSSVIDVFHCTWSPALILSSISKIYDIRIEDFGLAWNSGKQLKASSIHFRFAQSSLWFRLRSGQERIDFAVLAEETPCLGCTAQAPCHLIWASLHNQGWVWGKFRDWCIFSSKLWCRCWHNIQAWKRCIFVGGLISRWVVGYCRSEYHTWHSQTKKFHKELWISFLCFTCFLPVLDDICRSSLSL